MSELSWAWMSGDPLAFRIMETTDGVTRALAMYPIMMDENGISFITYGLAQQILSGPSPQEIADAVFRIECLQHQVRVAMSQGQE